MGADATPYELLVDREGRGSRVVMQLNSSADSEARSGTRRRCRVAIVGAGAAGLMAAQMLLPRLSSDEKQDTDHNTNNTHVDPLLILEARDRVGGRIYTAPLPNGVLVDIGAAWVHGTGVPFGHNGRGREEELNPMVKLLQQRTGHLGDTITTTANEKGDPLKAGLTYTSPKGNPDTRPRDVLHSPRIDCPERCLIELHVGGKRIEKNQSHIVENALNLHERILDTASKVGACAYECGEGMATSSISIGKTIDVIRSEAPPQYLLRYNQVGGSHSNLVETLVGYYLHSLQVWHPHDLASVQLSEFIVDDGDVGDESDAGGGEGDFPGPHCNVEGGMSSILNPLQSNGVKDCILCNQEVIRVERLWSKHDADTSVALACKSGTIVEADYCIVSIPIACLKHCIYEPEGLFCPRLSQEKEEAIGMLQMGCYKKVFLTFDEIFWDIGPTFIGLARKELEEPLLFGKSRMGIGNYLNVDNSIAKQTGKPILEITLVGGAVQWANGKKSEAILPAVLEFLDESMFVEDGSLFSARCTDCYITRWEEDRHSMGAYAGFKIGTLERHAASLAEPEWDGRLVFAGDAVISEYEGSVHGALLSGKEAANKIGVALSN